MADNDWTDKELADKELHDRLTGVRQHIQREVTTGLDDPDTIVIATVDYFSDEFDEDILGPIVERWTQEAVAAHQAQQIDWPEVTDCDRLDAAFDELNQAGIVSRHNFSCCGNCGVAEIGDEMQEANDDGVEVIGYTFYHMQDTESAVEGGGLHLNYGSVEGSEEAMLEVAEQIVETLERHGLTTEWNGRTSTRIQVQLDWKRRLPVEA